MHTNLRNPEAALMPLTSVGLMLSVTAVLTAVIYLWAAHFTG